MLTVSWLAVCGIAAIKFTLIGAVTPEGVVYVALVATVVETVPHWDPVQDGPDTDHSRAESPFSVAVIETDCPASSAIEDADSLEIPPPRISSGATSGKKPACQKRDRQRQWCPR